MLVTTTNSVEYKKENNLQITTPCLTFSDINCFQDHKIKHIAFTLWDNTMYEWNTACVYTSVLNHIQQMPRLEVYAVVSPLSSMFQRQMLNYGMGAPFMAILCSSLFEN